MRAAGVNRASRLVVVDSDNRARDYVRGAFSEREIRVIGEAEDVKSGMRFIRGLQPDVVLIELPENASETIEALRKIKEELPDVGIILSRHSPSPELILSAMRAGAQEFVSRPIDGPELEKAIDHVLRQRARTAPPGSTRGTIISVFSSKGGVGGTSVSANLAVALASQHDGRTAVVDLNLQIGELGLMLNQPPRYNLTDAFVDGRMDDARLGSVLSQHESGLEVLTVATSPEIGEEITRHHLVDLFGRLAVMYDFVIVDVGRHLDDRTVEVLELSDEILLLTTLDVPAVRNASRYLAMLERLEIDRARIRLVVNRIDKRARLGLRDVESALGVDTSWAIPNDFEPVSTGIDHGTPAVLRSRRSKVAKSVRQFAESLCSGRRIEEEAAAAPVPENGDHADEEPAVEQVFRKEMKTVQPSRSRGRSEVETTPGVSVHVDLPGF